MTSYEQPYQRPYLIMHRKGVFTPGEMTCNQCSKEGQEQYFYRIILAFNNTVAFDDMAFICDSAELEQCITNLKPTGSCEQMLEAIHKCIYDFFKDRKIDILTWKFAIVSEGDKWENRSWFEHVHLPINPLGSNNVGTKIIALQPHLV